MTEGDDSNQGNRKREAEEDADGSSAGPTLFDIVLGFLLSAIIDLVVVGVHVVLRGRHVLERTGRRPIRGQQGLGAQGLEMEPWRRGSQ